MAVYSVYQGYTLDQVNSKVVDGWAGGFSHMMSNQANFQITRPPFAFVVDLRTMKAIEWRTPETESPVPTAWHAAKACDKLAD